MEQITRDIRSNITIQSFQYVTARVLIGFYLSHQRVLFYAFFIFSKLRRFVESRFRSYKGFNFFWNGLHPCQSIRWFETCSIFRLSLRKLMKIREVLKMRSLMKKKIVEKEEISDYLELPALVSFPRISKRLRNNDTILMLNEYHRSVDWLLNVHLICGQNSIQNAILKSCS